MGALPKPKVYEVPPLPPQRDNRTPHTNNFFSCVRSRKPPNANADIGYRILTAIQLGVDAYRQGRTMLFDPNTQRILDKNPSRRQYEGDGKSPTLEELKRTIA